MDMKCMGLIRGVGSVYGFNNWGGVRETGQNGCHGTGGGP